MQLLRQVFLSHIFSFDRYEPLYLKSKDVLHIRKEGKLEIIQDPSIRKPLYCVSANLAFPHLYPHGEMSPLHFEVQACSLFAEEAGTVCTQNERRQTAVEFCGGRHSYGSPVQPPE